VAPGVPGRLRPRIFLTFGTTRVVGRQSYAPAAFTPGEISGTHFQRLSRPQGTWFRRGESRKKSPVTPPGINPGTVRLVAQCLNHYSTPGDRRFSFSCILFIIIIGGILVLLIYITRLASSEIFSPSNKIHREVGRAKDLSAPRHCHYVSFAKRQFQCLKYY